ncbi:MAG: hypothetical protein K5981_10245, partial [Clostridia bacterium]|nr:hypothetical protein [Clostridia bacterium]
TDSDVKSILEYMIAQDERPAGGGSGSVEEETKQRTVVTHLGVAKAKNGNRFLIPALSTDEIYTEAEARNAEVLTVFNAGNCGFRLTDDSWSLLTSVDSTVVSLLENGALTATHAGKSGTKLIFSVTDDGSGSVAVDMRNAKLSSPDYTVYEGKSGYQAEPVTIEFTPDDDYNDALAFQVQVTPSYNKAVFSIPKFAGSGFELTTISPLKNKCALRYGGVLALKTPITDILSIDIDQLQINYEGSIALGGISGGGAVNIPSIAGFAGGGAEVHLNTFDGESEFYFMVEMETPVFEGMFELAFKEARGVFLPDTLYAEFGLNEGGIPLVPPTIIGYLQGGGIGFEGLADTINMNSFGAPPIRLKVAAKASIIDVIDGWAKVSVGPSGFDLTLEDIEIKGLKLIDEYGLSASWTAENRKIDGKTYWGVGADMQQYLVIAVKVGDSDPIISAEGRVKYGVYAGYCKENNTLYFVYQLNASGSMSATIQIPKKLVAGSFPTKNYKLADATVGYYAEANFHTKVKDTSTETSPSKILKSLASNANIKIGAAVGAKVTISVGLLTGHIRIVYVLGDTKPKISGGMGSGDPLDLEAELDKAVPIEGRNGVMTTVRDNATGEIYPAVVEASATKLAQLNYGENNSIGTDTIEAPMRAAAKTAFTTEVTAAQAGNVLLFVRSESGPLQMSDVMITHDGAPVTLIPITYDENGVQTSGNDANFLTDEEGAYFVPSGAGEYHFSANAALKSAELYEMTEFAELSAATLGDASVTWSMVNPGEGRKYKVSLLIGEEKGAGDYLLAEQELSGSVSGTLAYELTGAVAPSGNYYPTFLLLEEISALDENGETVTRWAIVDQRTFSAVSYTNNSAPAAPASVRLNYTGNGTMTATWSAVDGADSYVITVYNADGTDTGVIYTAGKDETSLIMALRAGSDALESGKSYLVGVRAIIGDMAKDEQYLVGSEGRSASAALRNASAPTISFSDNVTMESSGLYSANSILVPGSESIREYFTVTAGKALNIRVTDAVTGDTVASGEGVTSLSVIAELAGERAVQVVAEDPATLDYALAYVTVRCDSVAPPMVLDDLGVYPLVVKGGSYTADITGTAEAGATIKLATIKNGKMNYNDILFTCTAAADGSFTLPADFGKTKPLTDLVVQAWDGAGNTSEPIRVTFGTIALEEQT